LLRFARNDGDGAMAMAMAMAKAMAKDQPPYRVDALCAPVYLCEP
jgi:hypothetical protein